MSPAGDLSEDDKRALGEWMWSKLPPPAICGHEPTIARLELILTEKDKIIASLRARLERAEETHREFMMGSTYLACGCVVSTDQENYGQILYRAHGDSLRHAQGPI